MTFLNSNAGGVKFITGLPTAPITTQASGQPSMMLVPQTSNGVAQGYQLLTFGNPGVTSSNQKLSAPAIMSQLNVSQTEQKKLASKSSSASSVPKFSAVMSNQSVIIGNIPLSSTASNSEKSKQVGNLHNLNSAASLQLFNHGVQPHLVPVATFHAQNSSQSSGQQKSKLSDKVTNSAVPKSGRLTSPAPSTGRPTGTPVPRIYTPTPGSSSSLLSDMSRDRHTPVPGSSLLIQSNLSQLQNSGAFNRSGQFNPQSYAGDHAGLSALVGIRPGQGGDAHHTIRLQGYQGIPAQRLAMYSEQAIRPNFPSFPAGGRSPLIV